MPEQDLPAARNRVVVVSAPCDKPAEKAVAKRGRTAVGPGRAEPRAKAVDPAPSLLIGSNNNAGMGYAWARAVEQYAGIRARNIQKKSYAFGYGSDIKA